MNDAAALRKKLQTKLASRADAKSKAWQESYVKHDTRFRGVG